MNKKTFATFLTCLFVLLVFALSTNIVRAYSPDEIKGLFSKKNKTVISFSSVDVGKLRKNLTVYKEADEALKAIDDEYSAYTQTVLLEQNRATNQLMQEYEAKKVGLSQEEALILLEQYNEKASVLAKESQEKLDAKQKALDEKRNEIEKDARTKVKRIIRDVAAKENVRYIIDKKSGLYVRHDLTDKIIEAATKEEKKKKKLFGVI